MRCFTNVKYLIFVICLTVAILGHGRREIKSRRLLVVSIGKQAWLYRAFLFHSLRISRPTLRRACLLFRVCSKKWFITILAYLLYQVLLSLRWSGPFFSCMSFSLLTFFFLYGGSYGLLINQCLNL